jgi:hypothetical protein
MHLKPVCILNQMNPVHTFLANFINIHSNTIQKELQNVKYFNHLCSVIFHQQTGLKFKVETGDTLHFEHIYAWC